MSKEQEQKKVFIISEDTQQKIMHFLDQCPYGSVKEIVAGMNAGKFVPVQVVDPPKNGQPPKAKKSKESA